MTKATQKTSRNRAGSQEACASLKASEVLHNLILDDEELDAVAGAVLLAKGHTDNERRATVLQGIAKRIYYCPITPMADAKYKLFLTAEQHQVLIAVAVQARKELAASAEELREKAMDKTARGRFAYGTLCKADACQQAADALQSIHYILHDPKALKSVDQAEVAS